MQIPAALLTFIQPKLRDQPIQKEVGTPIPLRSSIGMSNIQISQWPNFAPFLALLEENPAGQELWQSLFQSFSKQTPDSTSLQKFTSLLYQQLSESSDPSLQRLAPALLKLIHELEIPLPPIDRVGDVLRHLKNNDFPAAENSLRTLVQTLQPLSQASISYKSPVLADNYRQPTSTSTPQIPESTIPQPALANSMRSELGSPPLEKTPTPSALVRLWPALREFTQWSSPEQKAQLPSAPEALRLIEENIAQPTKSLPANLPSGLFVATTQRVTAQKIFLVPQTPLQVQTPVKTQNSSVDTFRPSTTPQVPLKTPIPMPLRIEIPQMESIANPSPSPLLSNLQEGQSLTWRSIPLPSGQVGLLPLPYTASVPMKEQIQWVQTSIDATPNLVQHREQILEEIPDITQVPPTVLQKHTEILHQLDLQLPPQVDLPEESNSLTLRWILSPPSANKPSLDSLLHYVFQQSSPEKAQAPPSLPAEVHQWIQQKSGNTKIFTSKELALIVEQTPESIVKSLVPEAKTQLQELKQNLQWSRFDEETRHPEDRQQVFYFHHQGELLRSRIRYRYQDAQESSSQNPMESTHHIHIDTSTPRLGPVQLELDQKGSSLRVEFIDTLGSADEAIQQERQSLSEELSQIGYQLQELFYRRLSVANPLPIGTIANQQPISTHLDLRI